MRRLPLEFVSSLLFSVVGFLLFAGIHNVLETLRLDMDFGGDKGKVLLGLFFGLPLGGTFGAILVEKLIYKGQGWSILSLGSAVGFGFIGSWVGLVMLDEIGGGAVVLIPIVAAMLCVLGYNIGTVFR